MFLYLYTKHGLAAQVGFDYQIDENWSLNASARYIKIDTTAEFTVADVKGSVDVDIDPYVFTISAGYKF